MKAPIRARDLQLLRDKVNRTRLEHCVYPGGAVAQYGAQTEVHVQMEPEHFKKMFSIHVFHTNPVSFISVVL